MKVRGKKTYRLGGIRTGSCIPLIRLLNRRPWVLAENIWNDAGRWYDNQVWND